MKKLLLAVAALVAINTQAATINAKSGELYRGSELVNELPNGKTCYLYVDNVEVSSLGLHCHSLTVRPVFNVGRNSHPKDQIIVKSRITNYHRPEYPQLKTCASNLDGTTTGTQIYNSDDSALYNEIFSWEGRANGFRFDYFVTFSPETKQPIRSRLHRMNWMTETNYDCVSLQKL